MSGERCYVACPGGLFWSMVYGWVAQGWTRTPRKTRKEHVGAVGRMAAESICDVKRNGTFILEVIDGGVP